MFSKTCEYAMRAVFLIAHRTANGGRVGIKDIAASIDSPEHFLAKILQDLSKRGIIQSAKGPHGGFYLDKKNLERPLADVVEAVDGSSIFTGCGLGLEECSSERPCPLHNDFMKVRNQLQKILTSVTIGQFNEELNLGIRHLKR
ncbi:MAG: Rrf2 family transcriptional regulator [Bacteroidota bacterium]